MFEFVVVVYSSFQYFILLYMSTVQLAGSLGSTHRLSTLKWVGYRKHRKRWTLWCGLFPYIFAQSSAVMCRKLFRNDLIFLKAVRSWARIDLVLPVRFFQSCSPNRSSPQGCLVALDTAIHRPFLGRVETLAVLWVGEKIRCGRSHSISIW